MKILTVLQHTSAEYLGYLEDHLEGRSIGFRYCRPFTEGTSVPRPVFFTVMRAVRCAAVTPH